MITIIICIKLILWYFNKIIYKGLNVKMNHWKELLLEGNKNYDKSKWFQAEQLYRIAEKGLDKFWHEDQTNIELLMAWVCAAHNLAAVYEKQGNIRISLQYLVFPHKRMLKLSQGEHNDNALTMAAIKALKITLTPIIEFRKKHILCQDCYNALAGFNALKERQEFLLKSYH